MRNLNRLMAACFLLFFSAAVAAIPPLVDGAWLKAQLGDNKLVVLDIQGAPHYQRYHVPGAVNAPYALWRTGPKEKPSGMLPPLHKLEDMLGRLGINNQSTVVIVNTGQGAGDLAAAARVFWTFKVLGHKEVTVLNGGLVAYARQFGGRLEAGAGKAQSATYQAEPDLSLLADADKTMSAISDKAQILDARSPAEYLGILQAGVDERPGTLPGAKNLPFDWLALNGGATLRDRQTLGKLWRFAEIEPDKGSVHFCHTGNRAALSWFVDYAVFGNQDASLYDGSTAEWARRSELPMEREISL